MHLTVDEAAPKGPTEVQILPDPRNGFSILKIKPMASSYSPTWRRWLRTILPSLFRQCKFGNYHWWWEQLCYCGCGAHIVNDDGELEHNGGIWDMDAQEEACDLCRWCGDPIRERTDEDPSVVWNSRYKWVHVENETDKKHYAEPKKDDPPPGPPTPPPHKQRRVS